MPMRKHSGWMIDLAIVILCVLIVITAMAVMQKCIQIDAEKAQTEAIIAAAQAQIDAYYASMPARERPMAVTVEAEPDTAAGTGLEPSAVEAVQETSEDASGTSELADVWYIEGLPLARELQQVAYNAACDNGVDYLLVLAVIQIESGFDPSAVSYCGSYGLMQLNPRYFPSGLTNAENIQAGTAYLGQLLEQYQGDVPAALRAYNRGYDDGARGYSNAVLAAEESWRVEVTQ